MIRLAGIVIALAGTVMALALIALGRPGGFMPLMASSLVLWFAGLTTAAGCAVPARPWSAVCALVASVMAWAGFVSPDASVVCGGAALLAGLVIALRPDDRVSAAAPHPPR